MLLNLEKKIEGYELKIVNPYRLKEIMFKFALAGKHEHRIVLGDKLKEDTIFEIDGTERVLIRNLITTDTGKTDWTYDDHLYRVFINEYDVYDCPKIYTIIGTLINGRNVSSEGILSTLSLLSKMCEMKKIPQKKVFDKYIEEILSLIVLERKSDKYIEKLNRLYEILYVENEEDEIFPKEEFMQKYKVYKYDLKNIKKVQ